MTEPTYVHQGIFKALNAKAEGPLSLQTVHYTLEFEGEVSIDLNALLGKKVQFEFTGKIACQGCGKPIKKVFQAGYCFLCSTRLACCDLCIVRPERCHFHLGTCREPAWGEAHCMQDHFVYLANTSGLKVGMTRAKNIPTRWLDQGAVQALPVLRASTRRLAGYLEVALAKHIPDKTDWRKMLKGPGETRNLIEDGVAIRQQTEAQLCSIADQGLGTFEWMTEKAVRAFEYPVLSYPQTITSLSLDKTPHIEGDLLGIKGQYVMLSGGVLNLGKFEGYEVKFAKCGG
jgi:Protein of unknown function (DUF2797)